MKNEFLCCIFSLLFLSCKKEHSKSIDFRNEMRNFVIQISQYAKTKKPGFIIIPQNGQELITINGEVDGNLSMNYINAIDGTGREDAFYGYDGDDIATPTIPQKYIIGFLDRCKQAGKTILSIDYCSTPSKMSDSYNQNNTKGYISFAADHRNLDNIPSFPTTIYNENNNTVTQLAEAKNFLYLINPVNFTKNTFIAAIQNSNYDVLIMDLFINDIAFTADEINSLKQKKNGGKRLVICYMSVGEAEDYRYYWQNNWSTNKPNWLDAENPNWPGNYKVKYWDKNWQNIIVGNDQSYTKKILDANFDGVYLDIIDAFEYYQK